MIYTDFQGLKLSQLGFGAMRLPLLDKNNADSIDVEQTSKMIDYAYEHGVNYFDTAWPYHFGKSEIVLSKILKHYPRETYYLATKYPGHQIADTFYPNEIFEKQLEKCDVDYFDFYLLHNVFEGSIDTYFDSRWGIVDYFVEQKQRGKINYLGFSTHGNIAVMERFLEKYNSVIDFCQIQLNYVDWTLQNAKRKCELLSEYNIPIWVMEPVRGGRLANLGETSEKRLKELRSDETIASWAFRWLQRLPNVKVILSGMSDMSQVVDNIKTFSEYKSLSEEELEVLNSIAEKMKENVPCTSCGYCLANCPQQLNIPELIGHYNDICFSPGLSPMMSIEFMAEEKKPQQCISCGNCVKLCPQQIEIPSILHNLVLRLSKMKSWAEICAERNAHK